MVGLCYCVVCLFAYLLTLDIGDQRSVSFKYMGTEVGVVVNLLNDNGSKKEVMHSWMLTRCKSAKIMQNRQSWGSSNLHTSIFCWRIIFWEVWWLSGSIQFLVYSFHHQLYNLYWVILLHFKNIYALLFKKISKSIFCCI